MQTALGWGGRQEAHVSKVTIQDLDKMVNLLQPEQLIVRVINPDDEEERRVPGGRGCDGGGAGGAPGAPLVNNLDVLPLEEVTQLLLAREDQVGQLAVRPGLLLGRLWRVPLREAHLALSAHQEHELDLRRSIRA